MTVQRIAGKSPRSSNDLTRLTLRPMSQTRTSDGPLTLADFDYQLPEYLIAQHPLPQRPASRLLHLHPNGMLDRHFLDLPQMLRAGDLLVVNDTRVIKARLFGRKASGGQIEVMIDRILGDHEALALIRASKTPQTDSRLLIGPESATVVAKVDDRYHLRFDRPLLQVLETQGHLPLPPYIRHGPDGDDALRYQTVYSNPTKAGAVAAPTAGLHFDKALLNTLREQGIEIANVTLHVGTGTFAPVRTDNIAEHRMHSERFEVPAETVEQVNAARQRGGRVIAVGTTCLRSLESAARDGQLQPMAADTDLFVTPGFQFHVVDALITNFHLPKSTLMMLVSAFAGIDPIRRAYAHAIEKRYRFFSYGDAMFLERNDAAI